MGAVFLPVLFALQWLAVTTLLAVVSGWFGLMAKFPNQTIEPLLRLGGQSGCMGPGVSMGAVLTLSACHSGLRVGMTRVFGPFCRDFFVPWDQISITRKHVLWGTFAKLRFGRPTVGTLTIPARVANRLARAIPGKWPETGPFPEEQHRDIVRRLLAQWALGTASAALFFTVASLMTGPPEGRPPISPAILFPAIAFGLITIIQYVRETRGARS
jgi:hypothetical protein